MAETVDLEIIRHPGGAAAVALDAQGRVCLLRQYRHAGGGWLWELPAGKLDPGEDPFATARRELIEEAGVEAATWQPLGRMLSSPGVFTEVIHLYLGRDLTPRLLAHEGEEIIEIHWLPLDQALAWCLDGTILDAKTLIGLFRAAAVLGRALASRLGSRQVRAAGNPSRRGCRESAQATAARAGLQGPVPDPRHWLLCPGGPGGGDLTSGPMPGGRRGGTGPMSCGSRPRGAAPEARSGRNLLRWLNHQTPGNARFDGFDLYALTDIAAGEEITFDYGGGRA